MNGCGWIALRRYSDPVFCAWHFFFCFFLFRIESVMRCGWRCGCVWHHTTTPPKYYVSKLLRISYGLTTCLMMSPPTSPHLPLSLSGLNLCVVSRDAFLTIIMSGVNVDSHTSRHTHTHIHLHAQSIMSWAIWLCFFSFFIILNLKPAAAQPLMWKWTATRYIIPLRQASAQSDGFWNWNLNLCRCTTLIQCIWP